jgi:cellulose synthase/poly-beta-1,6-N-acetylglucosamine synthase-like glycosyltransferase
VKWIHVAAALVCAAVFFAMWSTSFSIVDLVIAVDVAAVVFLSAYALHEGILLVLYLWHKLEARRAHRRLLRPGAVKGSVVEPCGERLHDGPSAANGTLAADAPPLTCLPSVTVQLPLYNERYVAERVIAAACALDYPRELLQIQVLDDSTDDTNRIARRAIEAGRDNGVNVELVHRDNRSGYKAGALANGLRSAQGELIAIFDADFIPPRNFLQRVICQHRAFDDARVGFVQTRWGHLNTEANAVTRAQGLLLDMHFVVEQFARSSTGLKMNFNGSGGIWRRQAIEAAGGWQSDTLTEDLDLSYRAQLKGWRGLYLDGEVCPGELPNDVLAFKRQQARWARGSAQCVRKLAVSILFSNLPFLHKVAAILHVSGYFTSVFALVLALVTPLLMLLLGARSTRTAPQWLSLISVIGFMPMVAMFVSQCAQRRTRRFWHSLPMAVVLGIGVSLSNSVAVLVGLFGKASGEFVRTPKSVSQATRSAALLRRAPRDKRATVRQTYLLRTDWTLHAEFALSLYAVVACCLLAAWGDWVAIVPILIYACGFIFVVLGQVAPGIWLQSRTHQHQDKVASKLQSTK